MDAIKYSKLIDVGHFYGGLSGKTKDDFEDGNAKFITYMNVFSNPSLKTNVDDRVRIKEGEKQNVVEYGDVIFTGSSETPDECGMSSVLEEHTDEPLYLNSFSFGYRFNDIQAVFPAFFKHLFRSNTVRAKIAKTANGVTRFNVSKKLFGEIEIPIPTIPIQQKIATQLDSFTSLITNLETELASRQKQYEYYRNKLLTFDEADESVEWKTLGEVAKYSKERIHASQLNETNYVSVENLLQNKAGKINSTCCPTDGNWIKYKVGDVLIGNIRPNLRKIWLADIDGGTNGDVLTIRIIDTYKKTLNSKYLYHVLSSEDFFLFDIQNAKGAKMPRGDKDALLKYSISIPSLSCQQEIVSSLDTFESLISNIKQELDDRKKQYEYYREKLLTFE